MNPVFRGVLIYLFLLVVLRLADNRTFSQLTAFDFVLLLIIAEVTQQAFIGQDFSLIQAFLLIVTLIGVDVAVSLLKERFPKMEKIIDGVPVVLVENGKPLKERMVKARVDETDILVAARERQGIERMDQIKYAVLERSGGISIIPNSSAHGRKQSLDPNL